MGNNNGGHKLQCNLFAAKPRQRTFLAGWRENQSRQPKEQGPRTKQEETDGKDLPLDSVGG